MKLISLYNQMNQLERQRDEAHIRRLRDAARRTIREATMTLTPCPRCNRPRQSNDRPCERCSRAAVRQVQEHRPSEFFQALIRQPGDNPQGTRMVELRLQGKAAREHGDAAIRHSRQARFTLARSLEDSRQAHGIDSTGALAIVCLLVAAVVGLLWWTMPESGAGHAAVDRVESPAPTVPREWVAR